MKKKSGFLSAGLILVCLLFVQAARSQTPHTLLWKISGKGLDKPSYLFGTMHILCAEDAILSDSLKAVIARCEEVCFEIDLSDMKGMLNSIQYMRMKDGKKLSDLLSACEYEKVKSYFSKNAGLLPFGMLERFKPLLISSMVEEGSLACKTTDGMELMIMKEIRSYNKSVRGLETVEFQAGLFDSIPYEKQAKDLVNYIDSAEENQKMTQNLAAVYKRQDLDLIDSMTRKGDPSMNGYLDLLLYDRNRRWVKALDSLLPAKSLLIAVGAAHLPGKDGVIDLLRERGYLVTPIKN